MVFVPEGQDDSSQARSACLASSPNPSRRRRSRPLSGWLVLSEPPADCLLQPTLFHPGRLPPNRERGRRRRRGRSGDDAKHIQSVPLQLFNKQEFRCLLGRRSKARRLTYVSKASRFTSVIKSDKAAEEQWLDSCYTKAPCQNKCNERHPLIVHGSGKQETRVVRRRRMFPSQTPTVCLSACAR